MSNYTPKPGEGSMFKNEKRNGNEKAPAYRGYLITPAGEVCGLALWNVTTKSGQTILGLKADGREGQYWAGKLNLPLCGASGQGRREDGHTEAREDRHQSDDFDDEIPF